MLLIGNQVEARESDASTSWQPTARTPSVNVDEASPAPRARLPYLLGRGLSAFACLVRFSGALAVDRLLLRRDPTALGRELGKQLSELGGVWILLGRALSVRCDLFPPGFCDQLRNISDRSKPLNADAVFDVVERNLERPVRDVFSSFDVAPVETRWTAQKHYGVLQDGEPVIVTIARPGLLALIEHDLTIVRLILAVVDVLVAASRAQLSAMYPELRRHVLKVASLTAQGRNADCLAADCDGNSKEYVPHIYWSLSTPEVLVAERLDRPTVFDVIVAMRAGDSLKTCPAESDAAAVDPDALAKTLLHNFVAQIFDRRYLIADLDPRELVVLPENAIAYRDWASVVRVDSRVRRHQLDLLSAIRAEDTDALFAVMVDMIDPPIDADLVELKRRFKNHIAEWLEQSDDTQAVRGERRISTLLQKLTGDFRELRIPLSGTALAYAASLNELENIVGSLTPHVELHKELPAVFRQTLAGRVRRHLNLKSISDAVLEYEHLILTLPRYFQQSMHLAQQDRPPFRSSGNAWRLVWWQAWRGLTTIGIGALLFTWVAGWLQPQRFSFLEITAGISPLIWLSCLAGLMVVRRLARMAYHRCARRR